MTDPTTSGNPAHPDTGNACLGDLTGQHLGWEIHITDLTMTNAVRAVWVLGIAEKEIGGERLIEIRDALARPGAITLFRYPPDTPCKATRKFPQPRRRRRTTS
ncbi:hypothetical protein [Actinacidiphila acididurans]|uniref:Uncharacterized protein n=1 Tax=Actinacidiphila acididurans TaxID=2784346 RepID=A0ABS2U7A9_9ACTN|nr:hypothetical protein [Actinacidiphila acididurans]MBM9510053.1 hypothetical protein [Actinacidiphila acididurans]